MKGIEGLEKLTYAVDGLHQVLSGEQRAAVVVVL